MDSQSSVQNIDVLTQREKFYLHISSPDQVLYEGYAEAITALSEKGVFDILPLHENFISLIRTKVVVHFKIGQSKQEFLIEKGVIKVQRNKVFILVGFEVFGDFESEIEPTPANPFKVYGISLFNPYSTKI